MSRITRLSPEDLTTADFRDLYDVAIKGLTDLDEIVVLCLLCYFAAYRDERKVNHVLLEGLNGTSKTRLAGQVNSALLGKPLVAFYELLGWDAYQRTAGSPDQSPADIVGGDVLGPDGKLVYREGPILKPCLLMYYADELNRSPPKTQAALLEAMAERQVTVNTLDPTKQAMRIRKLPNLFIFASQNPESHEGTFPLPEAQLDRFMCKVLMPYTRGLHELLRLRDGVQKPTVRSEQVALGRAADQLTTALNGIPSFGLDVAKAVDACQRVSVHRPGGPEENPGLLGAARKLEERLFELRLSELQAIEDRVRWEIAFDENVSRYIASIVYWTWSKDAVKRLTYGIERLVSPIEDVSKLVAGVAQGASPRAAFAMRDLSCALAAAQGEKKVDKLHVKRVAKFVLQHRVALKFQATMSGQVTSESIIDAILDRVG
jgi:MoxR-like ATPase